MPFELDLVHAVDGFSSWWGGHEAVLIGSYRLKTAQQEAIPHVEHAQAARYDLGSFSPQVNPLSSFLEQPDEAFWP